MSGAGAESAESAVSAHSHPTGAALLQRAAALVATGTRRLLGITGPPGAGKSTLAADLVAGLYGRAALVGMDGFHLDDAVLGDLGRRDRKGAPDTFDVDGYVHLLRRLRAAQDPVVYAPVFRRELETSAAGALAVPSHVPLVVTEGNYLLADGASVVVSDVDRAALERSQALGAQAMDVEAMRTADCDVYAPCALGGSVTDELVPALQARVVCGAANNQLAHPGVEKVLADRGILYTPDYVANAGGLVQVADEAVGRGGFRFERARAKATQIFDTTLAIFALADSDGVPPAVAADRLAERRMTDVGRLRSVLVPGRS